MPFFFLLLFLPVGGGKGDHGAEVEHRGCRIAAARFSTMARYNYFSFFAWEVFRAERGTPGHKACWS